MPPNVLHWTELWNVKMQTSNEHLNGTLSKKEYKGITVT